VERYKAWVITWLRNSSAANGNTPATPIGAPLAFLPVRFAPARIEAAMVAVYQLVQGSLPSYSVGFLKEQRIDEVKWDDLKLNACIGHDPQVWAHRAEIAYSAEEKDTLTGEGKTSYTYTRWADARDLRQARKAAMAAGETDPKAILAAAERAIRANVTTWSERREL
jgi:hypothetical protein